MGVDKLRELPLRAAITCAHAIGRECIEHLTSCTVRAVQKALPDLRDLVNAADIVAAGDIASIDGGDVYAIASSAVDLALRCKARGDAQVLDALAAVGYAVDSFVQWSSGRSDLHRAMVIDNVARAYDGLRSVPERHERIRDLPAALLAQPSASGSGDMDPVL